MDLSDLRYLFAYDRWASTKVLDAAIGIDEATWTAAAALLTTAGRYSGDLDMVDSAETLIGPGG
jgi:hypothetical protein